MLLLLLLLLPFAFCFAFALLATPQKSSPPDLSTTPTPAKKWPCRNFLPL
jgi:hypothetical protein